MNYNIFYDTVDHYIRLMMTSSNGNIFRATDPCEGNLPVTGRFSSQRQVTQSFDPFCDVSLNKRMNK